VQSKIKHWVSSMSECMDEPTEAEIDILRAIFDEVYVPSNNSTSDAKQHIPSDDGALCSHHCKKTPTFQYGSESHKQKPMSAYPRGWNDWCKECYAIWSDEFTEREKHKLRDELDDIVLATGQCGHGKTLHIPSGDRPQCCVTLRDSNGREWVSKPVEVFPVGHLDWCLKCVSEWRESQG